jgi:hypothetical protein
MNPPVEHALALLARGRDDLYVATRTIDWASARLS